MPVPGPALCHPQNEDNIFKKYLSGVLIVVLSLALSTTADAQSEKIGYNGPVVGPILGAAAAVAVVTIVVIHYSKKRTIMCRVNAGCLSG
jgi:hypothetical protein